MVNSYNACNSPDQKLNYQLIILQKKKLNKKFHMSIRVSAVKRGFKNRQPRPVWTLKSLMTWMQLFLGFLEGEKLVFVILEDFHLLWRVKSRTRMCHKWKWDMKRLCNVSEITAFIFFFLNLWRHVLKLACLPLALEVCGWEAHQ